jgi:hypothetical protein
VAVNTADVRQTKAAVKKSKRIVSRFDMCFLDMTMPPAKKGQQLKCDRPSGHGFCARIAVQFACRFK